MSDMEKEFLSARREAVQEAAQNLNHMINSSLFSIILKSELLFRRNKDLDRETKRALFTIREEAEKIHKAMKGLTHLYDLKRNTSQG
jgi:signal transduction histidine kinase